MAKLKSRDCESSRASHQNADSGRLPLLVEHREAQKEGALEPTDIVSRDQDHYGRHC